MKIYKSKIPAKSKISEYKNINYYDTFYSSVDNMEDVSADDLMVAFWTTMPKWLAVLYKIRNTLVKPFGLKTETNGSQEQLGQAIRNGESYSFMSVEGKTENETIISLDDKHLKAYFSVYKEEKNFYLTTLVRFHNKLGFFYFYAICPFHTIVVKNMFKEVINNLQLSKK